MRSLGLLAMVATALMLASTAGALPNECAGADLSDTPSQTYVWYDLSSCAFVAIDGDGDEDEIRAPAALEEIGNAMIVIVGIPIGNGGVCLVADPSLSGSVFVDTEHDCDEDPCARLQSLLDRFGITNDPCSDPCLLLDQAECDLRILTVTASTGRTRAIGSAPGEGASL